MTSIKRHRLTASIAASLAAASMACAANAKDAANHGNGAHQSAMESTPARNATDAPQVAAGPWVFRHTFTDEDRRMINHHTRTSANPQRTGEYFVDAVLESPTAAYSDDLIKTDKPYRSVLRRMYLKCEDKTLTIKEISVHEQARLAGPVMATRTFSEPRPPVLDATKEPYAELTEQTCATGATGAKAIAQ